MHTDFRSEVFKLCKKLQIDETSHKIGNMIHDMSVVVEPKEIGERITDSCNDFAYIAKHSNTEFYGFLYLDDNIGKMELPIFFKPSHLPPESRMMIERGHKTLTRFIDLCLFDVAAESNQVAEAMNPYFLNKKVNTSGNVSALLSDEEFMPAVSSLKNGRAYNALMDANFTKLFKTIDIHSMRVLISTLEKEIKHSLGEDVSKDLMDFSMKLHSKMDNVTDVTLAFFILMLALRMSLQLSCRMLYRAICGIDLFVLNDDNIINIEKNTTTVVSNFYKVFAQDIQVDSSGSEMGSVLLIDCELPHDNHIHEFGMLTAETLNLAGEFGPSAKYSFVTVNKELIYIHRLVDEVLKAGLPIVESN